MGTQQALYVRRQIWRHRILFRRRCWHQEQARAAGHEDERAFLLALAMSSLLGQCSQIPFQMTKMILFKTLLARDERTVRVCFRIVYSHTCGLVFYSKSVFRLLGITDKLTLRPLHLLLNPSGALGSASNLLEGHRTP
jgi:hypothetical protein